MDPFWLMNTCAMMLEWLHNCFSKSLVKLPPRWLYFLLALKGKYSQLSTYRAKQRLKNLSTLWHNKIYLTLPSEGKQDRRSSWEAASYICSEPVPPICSIVLLNLKVIIICNEVPESIIKYHMIQQRWNKNIQGRFYWLWLLQGI